MNDNQKVDIVIIDDDKHFTDVLSSSCFYDKLVDSYQRPEDFLKSISKYSLDTKIILDNVLPGSKDGVEIARELHSKGYSHLYILTSEGLSQFMGRSFQLHNTLTLNLSFLKHIARALVRRVGTIIKLLVTSRVEIFESFQRSSLLLS